MLLDLGEELLDLFGREVFDGDRLEEVLRRYESSLASPGDDLFFDLVDPERLTSSRGFAHQASFEISGTTATVYGTGGGTTGPENKTSRRAPLDHAPVIGCGDRI
jgi:hypothetical protein